MSESIFEIVAGGRRPAGRARRRAGGRPCGRAGRRSSGRAGKRQAGGRMFSFGCQCRVNVFGRMFDEAVGSARLYEVPGRWPG